MNADNSATAAPAASPAVSVVIPALNEASAIAAVLTEVRRVLTEASIQHELLVVDDGSTDATASIAAEAGATVLSHPQNMGYGRSLKTGIAHAQFDLIAITDADQTYPPQRLPELIRLAERSHMVVGQRTGRSYHGSLWKRLGRVGFRWLSEFATGRKIPDINSGMRVFRRGEILPFFPSIGTGFSFTTTATLVYFLNDLVVRYVPVEYHPRAGRSKVRYLRDTLRAVQIIIEAILWYNPIKIFLLASLPFAMLSVVLVLCALGFESLVLGAMSLIAGSTAAVILSLGFLAIALVPVRRSATQARPLEVLIPAGAAADGAHASELEQPPRPVENAHE